MALRLPYIPDVSGVAIASDRQLQELLVAVKNTLEQLTSIYLTSTGGLELTADNELRIKTKRYKQEINLEPGAVRLPTSNPPAEDVIDAFPFHRFDRGTEEGVFEHWEISEDYIAGGAVEVYFEFVVENPPAAVDEVVVMGVEYKHVHAGEVFEFTTGTNTATCSETIPAAEAANVIHKTSRAKLITTGFKPGDTLLLRLYRDATNGADTYDSEAVPVDNDVWVFKYDIEYESNGLGEEI